MFDPNVRNEKRNRLEEILTQQKPTNTAPATPQQPQNPVHMMMAKSFIMMQLVFNNQAIKSI